MTVCFVPNCNHSNRKDRCQFFRFPQNVKEKKRWIQLIRRADREPNESSRVCSCHFPNGNKGSGPSIFPWNRAKLFNISFPNEMKTTRATRKPPVETVAKPGLFYNNPREPQVQIIEDVEFIVYTPPARVEEANLVVYDASAHVEEANLVVHDASAHVEEADLVVPNRPAHVQEDKSTQTINSLLAECEITLLKSEIESLKAENSRLLKQPFRFASIQHNDSVIKYYTGINEKAFYCICEMVSHTELKYFHGWKPVNMNVPDQILMTLMKLKLNLDYIDLEVRFNVSKRTIANIILTFIHVLREVLFERGMENIPSQQGNVSHFLNSDPSFENSSMVIDCAEFCCELPNFRDEVEETSDTNKHTSGNTLMKGTVGVAPNGFMIYASKLCIDSSADKNVARLCNIVDIFQPGDFVLNVEKFLQNNPPHSASLNGPPSSSDPQNTNEIAKTKKRIRSRMHLERSVRRLRLFRILHSIPKTFHKYSSTIFQLCVALTNYEALIGEIPDSSNSNNSMDISVPNHDIPSND